MAANNHLNKRLFHGTGGEISGGIVKPGTRNKFGTGAYATVRRDEASGYAEEAAQREGRLFGTVYQVEPMSKDIEMVGYEGLGDKDYALDKKGFNVVKPVAYPINPDVKQPEQFKVTPNTNPDDYLRYG